MPLRYIYLLLCIPCMWTAGTMAFAQEKKILEKQQPVKQAYPAATQLSRSLEEDKPDDVIAAEYEELARTLASQNVYDKAEEYYQRALQMYVKIKQKDKLPLLYRALAKVQEAQGKYEEAGKNYREAARLTTDEQQRRLNENDADRLTVEPAVQSKYITSNIGILKKSGSQRERTDAYKQMADAFVAEKKYEEAIDLNKQIVADAKETGDIPTAINQLQSLSANYFEKEEVSKQLAIKENVSNATIRQEEAFRSDLLPDNSSDRLSRQPASGRTANETNQGVEALRQAYELALESGRTLDAKKSMDLLAEYYQSQGDRENVLLIYRRFLQDLDTLIRSDSTLIDTKFFHITEARIDQLEKERALKDELIARQHLFNYMLLGFIVLLCVLLFFIIRSLYTIKTANKKIALQSLRREMNPHFIFNSLNSVNYFIARNDEVAANKYLISYSKLMRISMENSNNDFIKLSNELDLLKDYLDLEHLRFNDKFDYVVSVDGRLDPEQVFIPNMLLQPHLENAIWHGLRYKEGRGLLILSFRPEGEELVVMVDDNGIGLQQSRAMKTTNQRKYDSRGLTNIRERIKLLNRLYYLTIKLDMEEKSMPDTGVLVIVRLPLHLKKQRNG